MNDTEYANAISKLPTKIKQEFKELFPEKNSLVKDFLKNTEYLHDINEDYKSLRTKQKIFFRNNKIKKTDYDLLLNHYATSNFTLQRPITLNKKTYTKISKTLPKNDYVYFKILNIFLTN